MLEMKKGILLAILLLLAAALLSSCAILPVLRDLAEQKSAQKDEGLIYVEEEEMDAYALDGGLPLGDTAAGDR